MTDSYSRRQLAGAEVNKPTREELDANRVRDINKYNAENTDQTIPVGHIIQEKATGFTGFGTIKFRYKRWDGTKYVSATENEYNTYVNTKGFIGPTNSQGIVQQTADLYKGKKPTGGDGDGDGNGPGPGSEVEPEPVNQPFVSVKTEFKDSSWESKNNNLRYPYERMESTQDYIQFSVIQYQRKGLTGGPVGTGLANQGTGVFKKALDADILGTVTLPVPSQIGDNNGADYGSGNLNFLQERGLGVAQQAIRGQLAGALGEVKGLLGDLTNANGLVESFFANQAISSFGGNIDLNQLLVRSGGTIINPNMELLFTGPKLRSFTFAFKFTPRFSKEAEEVRQIIRAFKKHSSPRTGGNKNFLKSPDIFQIRYLGEGGQNHQFLNRFKLCALTNMTVNYTGDGVYATYDDGTPVSSIMTLTFNELTPVYNEDYDGSVGGVGY